MSREVIAIIKHDPKLKEFEARYAADDKTFKERMSFIEKQAENALAERAKIHEVLLGEMEAYLIESKKLEKPIAQDKQHLCFSSGGTIDIHSGTFHEAITPNGNPTGGGGQPRGIVIMEIGRPPK